MTWTQTVQVQAQDHRKRRHLFDLLGWRLLVLAAALITWWLIAILALLPATLVPNPIDVFATLVRLLVTSEFWGAVSSTLAGAALGLLVAILVALPIGIITGRSRYAELSTRFLLDFGRAFPAVALTSIVVLMLGRTIEMKAVLVFVAVVFPLAIQTQHGVHRIDPMIDETCRAFRVPRHLYVRKVLLPNAAPYVMTGLRLAASVAVLIAISTEVLTGAPGIGKQIVEAQLGADANLAFAYIIAAALLGYAVNVVVGAIQRRVIRWRPNVDPEE